MICVNYKIRLANNLNGKYKRGVGLAIQGCIGNLGGIIASNIFLTKDEPRYIRGRESFLSWPVQLIHVGHNPDAVGIGFSAAGLLVAAITVYTYYRLNAFAQQREEDEKVGSDGLYVL